MGSARTRAISQNFAAYLIKQSHVGLDVIAVKPNALVLDQHARLAVRCRPQGRTQARYRRVQIVTSAIELGMGPQLHSQRLAVDQCIHAQRKPLGKRRRFLAAPHLIRDGKPVALGAKRPKHADLDMANHIDTLGIASPEQTLAFALKVVTQRIPRQLAHRELLSNSSGRLTQTMHRKARKQPIRRIQNP